MFGFVWLRCSVKVLRRAFIFCFRCGFRFVNDECSSRIRVGVLLLLLLNDWIRRLIGSSLCFLAKR